MPEQKIPCCKMNPYVFANNHLSIQYFVYKESPLKTTHELSIGCTCEGNLNPFSKHNYVYYKPTMFLICCHQVPKGSNDVFVVFPKFPSLLQNVGAFH